MDNMEMAHPAAVAGTTAPTTSVWSRIGNVFFSPTKAFEGLRVNSGTIITLLIVAIILGAVSSIPTAKYQAAEQVQILSKSTTIPPAYIEQMRIDAQTPHYARTAIVTPIVIIIVGLIVSLLYWLLGGFVLGGKRIGFGQVWAVSLLAGLIPLAGAVLKVPFMLAKESTLVSFGPAALFSDLGATSIFYLLMNFLDIFAIWGMIVTGIGLSTIFAFSKGKGITISVAVSLAFIVFMVGLAVFGMSMAGVEMTFF